MLSFLLSLQKPTSKSPPTIGKPIWPTTLTRVTKTNLGSPTAARASKARSLRVRFSGKARCFSQHACVRVGFLSWCRWFYIDNTHARFSNRPLSTFVASVLPRIMFSKSSTSNKLAAALGLSITAPGPFEDSFRTFAGEWRVGVFFVGDL